MLLVAPMSRPKKNHRDGARAFVVFFTAVFFVVVFAATRRAEEVVAGFAAALRRAGTDAVAAARRPTAAVRGRDAAAATAGAGGGMERFAATFRVAALRATGETPRRVAGEAFRAVKKIGRRKASPARKPSPTVRWI